MKGYEIQIVTLWFRDVFFRDKILLKKVQIGIADVFEKRSELLMVQIGMYS